MAWYDKFKVNNTHDSLEEIVSYIQEETPVIETEPEEEWIWVEGYKGVDQNMQGYGSFQYELGTEYTADGEIKACSNGFHFCLKLTDAFHYKDCLTHRFFKVRAYVKKNDVDSYGTLISFDGFRAYGSIINKLAAQKIILTEEITETEEVLTAIKNKYYKIETYDDVKQARLIGYEDFMKNKYREKLSKYFSELFIELFIEKFSTTVSIPDSRGFCTTSYSAKTLESKTNEIIAYMEEGVSKDVAIYLLMK